MPGLAGQILDCRGMKIVTGRAREIRRHPQAARDDGLSGRAAGRGIRSRSRAELRPDVRVQVDEPQEQAPCEEAGTHLLISLCAPRWRSARRNRPTAQVRTHPPCDWTRYFRLSKQRQRLNTWPRDAPRARSSSRSSEVPTVGCGGVAVAKQAGLRGCRQAGRKSFDICTCEADRQSSGPTLAVTGAR